MTRYLLDTSIVSGALRPASSPLLVRRLELRRGGWAIASMVLAELRYGVERHPDLHRRLVLGRRVDELLETVPVLAFDAAAAEWLATERARIEREGRPAALADLVIASTAAVHGLVVVTRNVRHFAPLSVPVEDWGAE